MNAEPRDLNPLPANVAEQQQHYSRPALWITWLLGAAMLATAIGLALRFTDAEAFARQLTQAQPLWLVCAFGLQALTYAAQGQIFRIVLKAGNQHLSLGQAGRLAG